MAEQPSEPLDKLIERRKVPREPDWLSGNLGYPVVVETALTSFRPKTEVEKPVQQSDLLRPLLLDIARNGLGKAYENYGGSPTFSKSGERTPSVSKHVIVVGAGMAGLVAAYELKRAGHDVTIVETQDRVGGRVKTVFFKEEKLKEGELYSDGKFPPKDIYILPCGGSLAGMKTYVIAVMEMHVTSAVSAVPVHVFCTTFTHL